MKTVLLIAMLLGLAAPAADAHTTYSPTLAAVAYWKTFALKPSHLSAYWRGYFAGDVLMRGCHFDTSRGLTSYDCRIVNVTTPIGLAYIFRTGPCQYGYLIGSIDGSRKFTRFFRYCG